MTDRTPITPPTVQSVRRRVMIVEDEALVALDLERHLDRAGYECVGVADEHDEALALFKVTQPDLVLMDIFIRGQLDGIDTARDIAALADTPVVFLTAFADDATVKRASDTSPYGYLLKPFDERTLAATLAIAAERHAADTNARTLSAAVEAATIGILLVEARGDERKIVFCNDVFVALAGHPREMILGNRPCFLAGSEDQPGLQLLRGALEGRQFAEATIQGRNGQGHAFWSTVTISPVPDRNGHVTHLLVFHKDITQQRQAEIALAESQRLEIVGRLSAGIAHDFNNTLGAILAFTELALDEPEAEVRNEDLTEVIHAARRGALLTRKLLDFSRKNDTGPSAICDLGAVARETRPMLERLVGSGIRLDVHADSEPTPVPTDATAVEQILLNLTTNARDAMPMGGPLFVSITRPDRASEQFKAGTFCRLQVTDTGSGMSPETAARIFEPFFTTKPRGRGTGLGLATCLMLVERAGGAISVHSEVGAGTTFTVDLPLVAARRETGPMVVVATGPLDAQGAVCLLVDDDATLRRGSARALSDAGFHVVEAGTAEAARREIDALGEALRLVISDLVLGGEDGATLLRYARQTSPKVTTLVVSGYYDTGAVDMTTLGPLLRKPYTGKVLARAALDALAAKPSEALVDDAPTPLTLAASPIGQFSPLPTLPETRARLLIVDLRESTAHMVAGIARKSLVETHVAATLEEAAAYMSSRSVDLLMIDADGPDTLDALRQLAPRTPVLAMTSNPTIAHARPTLRERGTQLIVKPAIPSELAAALERALAEFELGRLQRAQAMLQPGVRALAGGQADTRAALDAALAHVRVSGAPIVDAHTRRRLAWAMTPVDALGAPMPPALSQLAEGLGRERDLGQTLKSALLSAFKDNPGVRLVPMSRFSLCAERLTDPADGLFEHRTHTIIEIDEPSRAGGHHDLPGMVRRARDAGYRVAMGGIGRDATSLGLLFKHPVDIAHLATELTTGCAQSPATLQFITELVVACHRAGARVLASEIGTETDADALAATGCDLLAGPVIAPRPSTRGATSQADG
jgi:PAS domain S-box-containing protein